MGKTPQPRLMTIEEIKQLDKDGNCVWEAHDLINVWHIEGQQFVLSVAFDTNGGFSVPNSYYAGLDARTSIANSDTLTKITDEPSSNGYARQAISSSSGFNVALVANEMKAMSNILSFTASGGPWGPVSNLFFATTVGNTGKLISSVALSGSRIVPNGQSLSIRVSLSLSGCS